VTAPQRGATIAATSASGVVAVVQGVLLLLLLGRALPGREPEGAGVEAGLVAILVIQTLGFALDLPGLASRPFLWVKALAGAHVRGVATPGSARSE
jgi:hypothetical protein